MNSFPNSVWQRLERAGLVSGDAPESPEADSPWFVKLLLAASGWLASLFLLGALGVAFGDLFDSRPGLYATGAVLIFLAIVALKKVRNDFFEHSALALSLAGQGLIVLALFQTFNKPDTEFFWALALFQAALSIVVPSYVHRVWSSCIVVVCVFIALQRPELHHLVAGTVMFAVSSVWLNEYLFPNQVDRNTALAYGATLAVGVVATFPMLGIHATALRAAVGVGPADAEWYELPLVGKLLVFLVLLYTVWGVMRRYSLNTRQQRWLVLAAIGLGAMSFNIPGITIGVILMLLGFSGSNGVLTSIGFVALLGFFTSYYYQLEQTLLVKSGVFMALGTSLLVLRFVLPENALDKLSNSRSLETGSQESKT
ncbi:MAG: DUF4401 domain-containing protein [Gammaproteobacteria bacterium]